MTINEILIVLVIILIVVDIFFASDYPTHIAYILLTITIAKEINLPVLYKILFGIGIWFALVAFHYMIWRNVLEKISNKFIAPSVHMGGIEGFVGKKGVIREVEGEQFIFINDELHQFESADDKDILVGNKYIVKSIKSNKLKI